MKCKWGRHSKDDDLGSLEKDLRRKEEVGTRMWRRSGQGFLQRIKQGAG